jgi:hypothetical protein
VAGGGGFTRVDMSDDNDVDMDLFVIHDVKFKCALLKR